MVPSNWSAQAHDRTVGRMKQAGLLDFRRSLGLAGAILASLKLTKKQGKKESNMIQENVCLNKNTFLYLSDPKRQSMPLYLRIRCISLITKAGWTCHCSYQEWQVKALWAGCNFCFETGVAGEKCTGSSKAWKVWRVSPQEVTGSWELGEGPGRRSIPLPLLREEEKEKRAHASLDIFSVN